VAGTTTVVVRIMRNENEMPMLFKESMASGPVTLYFTFVWSSHPALKPDYLILTGKNPKRIKY
jgi:hypothetical protein